MFFESFFPRTDEVSPFGVSPDDRVDRSATGCAPSAVIVMVIVTTLIAPLLQY